MKHRLTDKPDMPHKVGRSVIVSASSSCFVSCPGCYNYFNSPLADTDTIISFLKRLTNQFNLKKVTVGGGDPLARKDIIRLLREIKSLGLFVSLDTVGTPLIREAQITFMGKGVVPQLSISELAECVDIVGIPVDGSSDDIMQKFRRGGHITDQILILNKLSNAKVPICINTVVNKSNLADLKNIFDSFTEVESVEEWQLFQFMPIGPLGFRNRVRFDIPDDEFREAINELREYVATKSSSLRFKPKLRSARKNAYLLIDGKGDVWLPRHSEKLTWLDSDTSDERIVIGSIYDEEIITFLQSYFA